MLKTLQSLLDELSLSVKHQCKHCWQRARIKHLKSKHHFQMLLFYWMGFLASVACMLWLILAVVHGDGERIDWHDWQLIEAEQKQRGIGEMGHGAYLPYYPAYSKAINDTHGYNGYLSDRIALNRSLKDLRPKECRSMKYSSILPSITVIIIFHNEHLSTLARTCISIIQRTPAQLLNEIILVDDASNLSDLGVPLTKHIENSFPMIKLLRIPMRVGLIQARMAGARAAKSDFLVFLDSHCEVYHNWLPPLLDAMQNDHTTVVVPTIDRIESDTLEYKRQNHQRGYASRGVFDWYMKYKLIPLLPDDELHPTKPFETPIMAGGLFLINAQFFWKLGAYDNGLNTYGGEQYDLSFKIWLCGGRLLETACSRIGHIYRYRPISVNLHIKYDFVSTNYKRVAEVWMDEYKEYLYNRQPMIYHRLDAGDLRELRALRHKLQCKPFKWFMENVAFDLLDNFPVDEASFAFGAIQNVGAKHLCADTMSKFGFGMPVGVFFCATNISHPHATQLFSLTLANEIRIRYDDRCWTVNGNAVEFVQCTKFNRDTQRWTYDLKRKLIINQKTGLCLDVDIANSRLVVNPCSNTRPNMKWQFGNINFTAYHISDH